MAAKVNIKVVGRTTKGGETFLKVSVSGRARWVSERGYSQMNKMIKQLSGGLMKKGKKGRMKIPFGF